MKIKNKTLKAIITILGLTSIFIENTRIKSLLVLSVITIYIIMKFTDYLNRKKIIKQITSKNMTCIKVKENNKLMIIYSLFLIYMSINILKSIFNIEKIKNYNSISDVISYIDLFYNSEKLLILTCVIIFILAILTAVQVLFSSSLITDDKVIFYDDLIFEINQIEEIKYKESLISKNKKIITLGKGFIDRKIIIKSEDFDRVKSLLETMYQ